MNLLCIGDIHLGCRPAGVPAGIKAHGVDPAALTPVYAWQEATRWAVENRVDAVLLAGDVVHHADDRFEAFGPLVAGVQRLVDAGIAVCAVAGNHDGLVLPRLAGQVPALRLLGRDGNWETVRLSGRDGTQVDIAGWSFPAEQFPGNPLATRPRLAGDVPAFGLLHADVDGGASPYAPVPAADLARAGVQLWLLGHVHKPSAFAAADRFGYLGSLMGLNPKETGPHGPWLLAVNAAGARTMRPVPLAPLRWESLELQGAELAGTTADDVRDSLLAALDARAGALCRAAAPARALVCRVRISGRCAAHALVRSLHGELRQYTRPQDGCVCGIESVTDECRPAVDLDRLAANPASPAGLLARRLLALEQDAADAGRSTAAFRAWLAGAGGWRASEPPPDEAMLAGILREAGWRVLEEVL